MKLFVEQLTVIDCAYLCHERGLVGESWICDVALIGNLDSASMIMDFAHVKKTIKQAIDQWVDHTLIVPMDSHFLTYTDSYSTELTFQFSDDLHLVHTSPVEALCRLPANSVTSENLGKYLESRLMEIMPATVSAIKLTLRTEDPNQAYYHYVHGLKKHDGNCQRIAHGHRSRIVIFKNGLRDISLEQQVAKMLAFSYIGTKEDVVSQENGYTNFAYQARQGIYKLSYPTQNCYMIEDDSTVECIAQHLAQLLKYSHPNDSIIVRAYEGVMKGAEASL